MSATLKIPWLILICFKVDPFPYLTKIYVDSTLTKSHGPAILAFKFGLILFERYFEFHLISFSL